MPSGKARLTGKMPEYREFSDELKQKLHAFFPDEDPEPDPTFGHPADHFVAVLLNAASFAISELGYSRLSLTKADLEAEHKALLASLTAARDKLRQISLGLDRLLPLEANPEGVVDELDRLISQVETAREKIPDIHLTISGGKVQRTKQKPGQIKHAIALETAHLVLQVLDRYRISTAATCDPDLGTASPAIQILKLIGDDIGLVYEPVTWRDIITKTKKIEAEKHKAAKVEAERRKEARKNPAPRG